MGYAVRISGANFTFKAPDGRDDVSDLAVFMNRQQTVSRWQLSPAELSEILRTGAVYVSIIGHGMPPIFIGSESVVRGHTAEFGPLPVQGALAPQGEGWRAISLAPQDGSEVEVYAPPAHGLPEIYTRAAFHPDAGWCVDELREVTHYRPIGEKMPRGP